MDDIQTYQQCYLFCSCIGSLGMGLKDVVKYQMYHELTILMDGMGSIKMDAPDLNLVVVLSKGYQIHHPQHK